MANNANKYRQNYVKVNVPLDEGMKGLITTLSSFELLETVECCEGHENRNAWVCFRYGSYWGHPWRELVNFVLGFMAPGLVSIVGDDVNVRIQNSQWADFRRIINSPRGHKPRGKRFILIG